MRGFGRARRAEDKREITDEMELLTQRIRLDVFCSDDHFEAVIETIGSSTHTSLHGDGKIYVAPVEDAVRIETGARSEQAIWPPGGDPHPERLAETVLQCAHLGRIRTDWAFAFAEWSAPPSSRRCAAN